MRDIKSPYAVSFLIFFNLRKSHRAIEFLYHAILRRRIITAYDRAYAAVPARLYHAVHHGILHVPLQYTAAHQPQSDLQHLLSFPCIRGGLLPSFFLSDHDRNDTIVTKPVLQFSVTSDISVICSKSFNIILRITSGRQIELVALIGQLRDPRHIYRLKRPDRPLHLQREQVLPVISKALLLLLSCQIGLIHLVALPVII